MILVQTFVAGLPKTKGSLMIRPNGTASNSRKRADGTIDHSSSTWRALMAGAVRTDWSQRCPWGPTTPHLGPVRVRALFYLPVDPTEHRAGDLDKLLRNLLDALASDAKNPRYNGGVILNDNQVTSIEAMKIGPVPLRPGVDVTVTTAE